LKRLGLANALLGAFLISAALFGVWRFVAAPRLYSEWRTFEPSGTCDQLGVFFDGTDQSFDRYPNDDLRTNVAHLALAMGPDDCRIYLPGIGARGPGAERTMAELFGAGSRRKRDTAYLEILRKANPSTRLFLLGAGTGALNAIVLSHTLERAGLTRVTARVDRRTGDTGELTFEGAAQPMPIAFLGLFDATTTAFSPMHAAFAHDLEVIDVPENVERAVHLVALDEPRRAFRVVHINSSEKAREVWFAGAHSDVAGGNGNTGVSSLPLLYMLGEIERAGLRPPEPRLKARARSSLSRSRRISRPLGITQDYVREILVAKDFARSSSPPQIHASVTRGLTARTLPSDYVAVGADESAATP